MLPRFRQVRWSTLMLTCLTEASAEADLDDLRVLTIGLVKVHSAVCGILREAQHGRGPPNAHPSLLRIRFRLMF